MKWYRKAAEQGYGGAQHNLGLMYWKATGVPQDFPTAYLWINIAAATGLEIAMKARETLTASMTPSQIEQGQELTRASIARNYKGC